LVADICEKVHLSSGLAVQDGRAANQFELPLGTKCPLPLVADICEKVHLSSGLAVQGGRAANQFKLPLGTKCPLPLVADICTALTPGLALLASPADVSAASSVDSVAPVSDEALPDTSAEVPSGTDDESAFPEEHFEEMRRPRLIGAGKNCKQR
jgi:hypothetical protein